MPGDGGGGSGPRPPCGPLQAALGFGVLVAAALARGSLVAAWGFTPHRHHRCVADNACSLGVMVAP